VAAAEGQWPRSEWGPDAGTDVDGRRVVEVYTGKVRVKVAAAAAATTTAVTTTAEEGRHGGEDSDSGDGVSATDLMCELRAHMRVFLHDQQTKTVERINRHGDGEEEEEQEQEEQDDDVGKRAHGRGDCGGGDGGDSDGDSDSGNGDGVGDGEVEVDADADADGAGDSVVRDCGPMTAPLGLDLQSFFHARLRTLQGDEQEASFGDD
jgi:hypothetical protein